MKRLVLIAALAASPVLATEGERPDFEVPSQGIIYTDAEIVLGTFACAVLAVGAATGPAQYVAAGAVIAAGACTIWMDWGLPFPVPEIN